jgi:hypothetical protein
VGVSGDECGCDAAGDEDECGEEGEGGDGVPRGLKPPAPIEMRSAGPSATGTVSVEVSVVRTVGASDAAPLLADEKAAARASADSGGDGERGM